MRKPVNYNRSLPPIATQFSKANFLGYQIWFSLISQDVCCEYKRHSTLFGPVCAWVPAFYVFLRGESIFAGGPPEAAIDLNFCCNTLGVSHEGNVKSFVEFMTLIDAKHHLEALVSSYKFKKSREVKNLECSINYDARGFGSSQGKAKRPNVMY
jgi:hypothetical protein